MATACRSTAIVAGAELASNDTVLLTTIRSKTLPLEWPSTTTLPHGRHRIQAERRRQYRLRLIASDMIHSAGHGHVDYALPYRRDPAATGLGSSTDITCPSPSPRRECPIERIPGRLTSIRGCYILRLAVGRTGARTVSLITLSAAEQASIHGRIVLASGVVVPQRHALRAAAFPACLVMEAVRAAVTDADRQFLQHHAHPAPPNLDIESQRCSQCGSRHQVNGPATPSAPGHSQARRAPHRRSWVPSQITGSRPLNRVGLDL